MYLISKNCLQVLGFLGQDESSAKDIHLGSMTGNIESIGDPFRESITFQLAKNRLKGSDSYSKISYGPTDF